MEKRKIFEHYNNFLNSQNMGQEVVGFLRQFFPVTQLAGEIALLNLTAQNIHRLPFLAWVQIPFTAIVIFEIIKYYGWIFGNYIIGRVMRWWGFWKYASEYGQKKEFLAPFNNELAQQLQEHTRMINRMAEMAGIPDRAENKFIQL